MWSKIQRYGVLILTISMACTTDPKGQIDAYLAAINMHDVERATSYLANDFRITFVDYGVSLDKAQAREALAWDAGANGHVRFEPSDVQEYAITGVLTEENDFLRLVGIPVLKAETTYRFDRHGLIKEQSYESLPGQASFQDAMQPAVAWAAEYRPEELAEIYPDGQMIYNEEMARRWVVLLKEWRAAKE